MRAAAVVQRILGQHSVIVPADDGLVVPPAGIRFATRCGSLRATTRSFATGLLTVRWLAPTGHCALIGNRQTSLCEAWYNKRMQSPNRRKFLQTPAIAIALPGIASSQASAQSPQRLREGREQFIRQAIEVAASARKNGNHPFGALLVDERGRVILTAENTALTTKDPTRHAELNLVQLACANISSETLAKATLYTSTEPCIMCCGAIHWARIPSVVFGCSAKTLGSIVKSDDFLFPCRETFRRTKQPSVLVVGPVLEAEAVVVHRDFWN